MPLYSTLGLLFLLGFTLLLAWIASLRSGLGLNDGRFDESVTRWIVGLAFVTPLMCAIAAGGCALFIESSYQPGTIPPYVAIRPMRCEGYLGPKLAVIGVSCGLTWLIVLTLIGVWLAMMGDAALVSKVWKFAASNGWVAVVGFAAASFVVLTLLLWRSAIAGMWLALAGRTSAYGFFGLARFALNFGAIALIVNAGEDAAFRATLGEYLTPMLLFGLLAKLILAVGAFRLSLARKAISREEVLLIVVGWLALGSFVAITGKFALAITPFPGAWIWMVLGGFYLLPLSGLALAPAAFDFNRHR